MKWLSLIFLLFITELSYSQSGLTRQYQFNYLSLNPALAGENGSFGLKGILGNQFNGTIRPNQVSQIVAIDGQLYNNSGLSFQGFRSNVGNLISTGITLGYAKGFELGDATIKFGVNTGIFVQPNVITVAGKQRVSPYAGLGILFKYQNAWLGVSNPVAFYSKRITESRPLFINLGYLYNAVDGLDLHANVLGGVATNQKMFDVNVKAWLFERLCLGASYRMRDIGLTTSNENLIPFVEVKVSRTINLGLSYDSNYGRNELNSPVAQNQNGVFQLLFRYNSSGAEQEKGQSEIF